jgi:hypothetical protein
MSAKRFFGFLAIVFFISCANDQQQLQQRMSLGLY